MLSSVSIVVTESFLNLWLLFTWFICCARSGVSYLWLVFTMVVMVVKFHLNRWHKSPQWYCIWGLPVGDVVSTASALMNQWTQFLLITVYNCGPPVLDESFLVCIVRPPFTSSESVSSSMMDWFQVRVTCGWCRSVCPLPPALTNQWPQFWWTKPPPPSRWTTSSQMNGSRWTDR